MAMDLIVETECRHFVIDAFACCYKKAQCKYSVIWRNRRIFISLSFFLSPLNPVLKAFCCFRFLIAFSSFAIRANFYSWQFGLCQLTFRTNVQETRTSDKQTNTKNSNYCISIFWKILQVQSAQRPCDRKENSQKIAMAMWKIVKVQTNFKLKMRNIAHARVARV